jgi:hypothetical protein
MEKSAELVRQTDRPALPSANPDLEFPIAPDFVSRPPRVNPEQVLALSASLLPQLTKGPGFWERRAEDRCLVEFDLEHPGRVPATYPMALIDELFGEYFKP